MENDTTFNNELRLYESDSDDHESDSEDHESEKENLDLNKKTRKRKPYKLISEYDNCQAAIERLKQPIADVFYRFRYTRHTVEGDKDYYYCQGYQKCPKTVFVLRHSDSLKASIYISNFPHIHEEKAGKSLPLKSVAHIKKLFDEKNRYTNNEIIASLKRHNCPQLTKAQINNLKQRLKLKRIGKSNCCLHEILEWSKRKQSIPDDLDEIFCGGLHYLEDEEFNVIELNVFVTTKRLISITKESHKEYEDGK